MSEETPLNDAADIPALPERSSLHIAARTAAVLVVFVVIFTAIMAATHQATEGPIAASAAREKLALIGEVLPPANYDNDLLQDAVNLPPTSELGLADSSKVYRARRGGAPAALVFETAAPDGYSGRIGLLLAVSATGELLAVRVTEHRETPGLGDYIDPKKDKNKEKPWITQFNALSLGAVTPEQWRVKKDGGRFDQRAGATISARAVTNAIARALAWTESRRERLFAAPAGGRFE